MVDPALIKSVKAGEKAAFKDMYESSIRYVYSIVRRYVSNESDHKDVIQEIFARVFLNIKSFDDAKGDFKFWLRRLVINQCLQHYRKSQTQAQLIPIHASHEFEEGYEEQFTELTKEEIENLLHRMPDGYKQVFMLVAIDEYDHKEISELLGITTETSRSQFHRARTWLKKNISNNNLNTLVNGL